MIKLMYCEKCGNEVGEKAKYCGNCGLTLRQLNKTQLNSKNLKAVVTEETIDDLNTVDNSILKKAQNRVIGAGNLIWVLGWASLLIYTGIAIYFIIDGGLSDLYNVFLWINILIIISPIFLIFIILGGRLRLLYDKYLFVYLLIILILFVFVSVITFMGKGNAGFLFILAFIYTVIALPSARRLCKNKDFLNTVKKPQYEFGWFWFFGVILFVVLFFVFQYYFFQNFEIKQGNIKEKAPTQYGSVDMPQKQTTDVFENKTLNLSVENQERSELAEPVKWDIYRPANNLFTAYLPETVEYASKKEEVEGRLGSVDMHVYVSSDELESLYNIIIYDYSEVFLYNKDLELNLRVFVENLPTQLEVVGVPVIKEESFKGYYALDFFISEGDLKQDMLVQGKAMLVSDKAYLIFVMCENNNFVPGFYENFIDVFEVKNGWGN